MGIEFLGPSFNHQVVVELATLQTLGRDATRIAAGDQYGVGVRYQLPLNHAWILRMDAMHGILEESSDITGARVEIRFKF